MNDEQPDILKQVTPRPAPAPLRATVLAAVDRELATDHRNSAGCHAQRPRQWLLSMLTKREHGTQKREYGTQKGAHGTHRRKPRWERAFELSAAACLALGIGLNAWQAFQERAWPIRDNGQVTKIENGAEATESGTQAGRLAEAQHWRPMSDGVMRRYDAILRELSNSFDGAKL